MCFDVSKASSFSFVSPCARSVTDIGDPGLPILSVVSSSDEPVVGRCFSCYEIIQTVCVFCALSSKIFPLNFCLSSPSALFICPKNCSCLFLVVLNYRSVSKFPPDLDECGQPDEYPCPSPRQCVNTEGSYWCDCLPGFTTHGEVCQGEHTM